jgi:pyruvate, orthophosphate dikinase
MPHPHFTEITPDGADLGARPWLAAKCLQRLVRLDLPVPRRWRCPSTRCGHRGGQMPIPPGSCRRSASGAGVGAAQFGKSRLGRAGHDPEHRHERRAPRDAGRRHGQGCGGRAVSALRAGLCGACRAAGPRHVRGGEPATRARCAKALRAYEAETEEPFPQDPARQLAEVLRSMARAWEGTTARLLRQAKGAPIEAGLGLVVQAMALGAGAGRSGAGVIQFVDPVTGAAADHRPLPEPGQGREALAGESAGDLPDPRPARPVAGGTPPEVFAELKRHGAVCRERLREEMQIEFTLEDGKLWVLTRAVPRSAARRCASPWRWPRTGSSAARRR